MDAIGQEFLRAAAARFEQWKATAEKAIEQLDDEQLHWAPDAESNSAAVLLQHLAGNLRSRWRDFLTSDGEKPDRNRDSEFVEQKLTREQLMDRWNAAWDIQRGELARLTPDDLLKTSYTRSRPEVVVDAILRQLAHLANHVGQIVYVAKQARGPAWRTLSIARGKSREFNESLGHRV